MNGLGGLTSYSIELNIKIDSTTGYVKLMDFSGLTLDTGLYNDDTALDFFDKPGEVSGAFTAGQFANVVLTYDMLLDQVNVYTDGTRYLTFTDDTDLVSAALSTLNLVEDDTRTGQREATSGMIDCLRIYDGALSDSEVANRTPPTIAPVPLPATGLLLPGGQAGLRGLRRGRR